MSEKITRRELIERGAVAAGALVLGAGVAGAAPKRRVLVWSEGTEPADVYPQGIRGAIAESLKPLRGWEIATGTITDPEQGIAGLDRTDVLLWWGHQKHGGVTDETVARIVQRVKEGGMGFVALHSSHYAKPYKALMGTPCGWQGGYYVDGSGVKMIVKAPKHPIAKGVRDFTIPKTERYGEKFEVNEPQTVVFDGEYIRPDGVAESARQGMVWQVGKGRVFYFQPGHETYPTFYIPEVKRIMQNAVQWLAPKR